MTTKREKLKALLARAADLKAVEGDFTDEQMEEASTIAADVKSLRDSIAKDDAARAAVKAIADSDPGDEESDEDEDGVGEKSSAARVVRVNDRDDRTVAKAFGDTFVKGAAYQSFRKAYPSGIGAGTPVDLGKTSIGSMDEYFATRKALLTTTVGHVQPVRMPTVDLVDRNRLTFLDLVSRGQTAGNFEYVQITSVTRNAKIVPEATAANDAAALKPVSEIATQLADAKVYTYADGYDVTNQLLADAPAFATYMNTELAYSLDSVVEDKLLNGTGVSGEPTGILATTGVQEQTYTAGTGIDEVTAKAFVRAVRQAITKVTRLPGGTVDAVVLSPEMDEAIDLLQDANERYYSGGPFGSGPATLWGRPRVTSERLTDTHAILGDFKQVALLDREGLSVTAFNQHKDYAQRNMVYVRAELRAAQAIWKPSRLVVVKPA